MKLVKIELMECKCTNCGATHTTDSLEDFKESNTYPPIAYFMCKDCKQISKLMGKDEIPRRLFSHLVNKITHERFGDVDQNTFNRLSKI